MRDATVAADDQQAALLSSGASGNAALHNRRRLCWVRLLMIVTSAVLLVALVWHALLEVMPQVGIFLYSSCRVRINIPGVLPYFEKAVHAAPSAVQPWLRQHFSAIQSAVYRNNASVILIGSMHKTGSELAKKLISVLCGQLSLCCYLMASDFASVDDLNALLAAPSEPLDIFFSNHFEWLPEHIRAPYSHLVFWYRKPWSQALSAFSYHGQGQEGGLRFPASACATDGRQPASERDVRRFCRSFGRLCLDAHRIATKHVPRASGAAGTQTLQLMPPAVYAFACDAVRPWIGYDAMDAWANRSAHASGLAATAAAFYFQSLQMARIMNQSRVAPARHHAHPPGREAAITTSAVGLDRDGRRALLIDIDAMMADYGTHVAALLDFVAGGLPRVAPATTRGLQGALSVYDVRHGYSIEALYETFGTGHVSSLDKATKRALLRALAARPHAREAYLPVLELMGPQGALM